MVKTTTGGLVVDHTSIYQVNCPCPYREKWFGVAAAGYPILGCLSVPPPEAKPLLQRQDIYTVVSRPPTNQMACTNFLPKSSAGVVQTAAVMSVCAYAGEALDFQDVQRKSSCSLSTFWIKPPIKKKSVFDLDCEQRNFTLIVPKHASLAVPDSVRSQAAEPGNIMLANTGMTPHLSTCRYVRTLVFGELES